jgi:hypothetical protein
LRKSQRRLTKSETNVVVKKIAKISDKYLKFRRFGAEFEGVEQMPDNQSFIRTKRHYQQAKKNVDKMILSISLGYAQ